MLLVDVDTLVSAGDELENPTRRRLRVVRWDRICHDIKQ